MTERQDEVRPGWEELGRHLLETGAMHSDWAPAFAAVDRAAFLPPLMWPLDPTAGSIHVNRHADPERWLRYADTDCPIVTQWDDGDHTGTESGAAPTSSASMPSLVMQMLADLEVEPGMRVLEIGTGTGWTAGLLAHRLGGAGVATIDVDEQVTETARRTLHHAGLDPAVLHRDGLAGDPPGAPYDRIIATCGVRSVPAAWIGQVRPGGIILAPWGTPYGNADALAKLIVAPDGKRASGWFMRSVEFMKARAQRGRWPEHGDYVPDPWPDSVRESSTGLAPEDLTGHVPYAPNAFVLGLLVPEATHTVQRPVRGGVRAWFYSLRDRSWAAVSWGPGGEPGRVCQHGERSLFTEVEDALVWWETEGRPDVDRFGLTVDADGEHLAWFDGPDRAVPQTG